MAGWTILGLFLMWERALNDDRVPRSHEYAGRILHRHRDRIGGIIHTYRCFLPRAVDTKSVFESDEALVDRVGIGGMNYSVIQGAARRAIPIGEIPLVHVINEESSAVDAK